MNDRSQRHMMKLIIKDSKNSTLLPQVMQSAIKLFVEKGIEGTTIKDIAADAKVSVGAMYNHFKGKEELAWYIFTKHLEAFTEELESQIQKIESTADKIKNLTHRCFEAFEEDRELFVYLIVSEHREFRQYPKDYTHPGIFVRQLIKNGQKSGDIKDGNPAILGALVLGTIIRTCLVRMYGIVQEDLRSFETEVSDSIWNAIRR